MKRHVLAMGLALGGVAPAAAAPLEFSGRADARAGYGSNPFLRPGDDSASGVLGFSISPTVRRTFATGNTSLSGYYSREQYFENQGHPDTAQITLRHTQELNPRLSMNASATYSSSSNALGSVGSYIPNGINVPGAVNGSDTSTTSPAVAPASFTNYIDPLTIGARTRRYQGDAAFVWRPSTIDTVTADGSYAHGLANRRSGIGSYTFYTGGISYTRRVGDRLQIGGRIGYSHSESELADTVSSYDPGVVLTYQFSEIWSFDSNIGVTIRHIPATGQTSTGLGFTASFCGHYPVTSVCISGSRVTSASGLGGTRVNTNIGVAITHQLTTRDSVTLNASYVDSKSLGGFSLFGSSAQQFTEVYGGYDHRIGTRLVVGLDGRFQTRDQDLGGNARSLTVTARIGYLFGRVS